MTHDEEEIARKVCGNRHSKFKCSLRVRKSKATKTIKGEKYTSYSIVGVKIQFPNCLNCSERSRSSPLRIEQIRDIVDKLLFNDGNSSVCFQLIPNSCFHFTMFDFSLRFAQTYQSGYGNKSPFNISSIIINYHHYYHYHDYHQFSSINTN